MNAPYSSVTSAIGLFTLLVIAGCSAFDDARIRQSMQDGQLKLGMPKHKVQAVLGDRPSFCVKRKLITDNSTELWDFVSAGCASNLTENYVLIFRNDSLSEIRTVSSQLDMQF